MKNNEGGREKNFMINAIEAIVILKAHSEVNSLHNQTNMKSRFRISVKGRNKHSYDTSNMPNVCMSYNILVIIISPQRKEGDTSSQFASKGSRDLDLYFSDIVLSQRGTICINSRTTQVI